MDITKNNLQLRGGRDLKKVLLLGIVLLVVLLVGIRLMTFGWVIETSNSLLGQPIAEQSSLVQTQDAADPDVPAFVALAEQAIQKAQQIASEVTLHQVIMDVETVTFFFTDVAATQEFVVHVPVGVRQNNPDQLVVEMTDPARARYIGRPASGINLDSLNTGPDRVKQAISHDTRGCTFSHLVLYPEGSILTWLAFCATSEGLVSGRVDNQTRTFHPGTLAPWPAIATPNP